MGHGAEWEVEHEAVEAEFFNHLDQFFSDLIGVTDKHRSVWSYLLEVFVVAEWGPVWSIFGDGIDDLFGWVEVAFAGFFAVFHDEAPRVGSNFEVLVLEAIFFADGAVGIDKRFEPELFIDN